MLFSFSTPWPRLIINDCFTSLLTRQILSIFRLHLRFMILCSAPWFFFRWIALAWLKRNSHFLIVKDRRQRNTPCYSLFFIYQPADVYLIDEPSAYLDSEQRLVAAKVIKRWVFTYICLSLVFVNGSCIFVATASKMQGWRSGESTRLPPMWPGFDTRIWGLFLESSETFRAHFGWHNSLCIFKTKASRGTKLCSYFYFYSLSKVWKDQLYRISRS